MGRPQEPSCHTFVFSSTTLYVELREEKRLHRPDANLFIVFHQNRSAPSLSDLIAGNFEVIGKLSHLLDL